MFEELLGLVDRVRFCTGVGGGSDHSLIYLQLDSKHDKPSSPFEFNPSWLEEFQNLVWNNCKSYDANLGDSECAQLANSLKIIEEKVVTWAAENYKNRDKVLTSNRHRK
jgi:hypothetical protein